MARKSKSTKKNTVPPFTAENLFKAASNGLNADFAKIRETMPHYATAGTETDVDWYQSTIKEVMTFSRNCLWLAGKESAVITLQAVWVQLRPSDGIILMSTSLSMDISSIISDYALIINLIRTSEFLDQIGRETLPDPDCYQTSLETYLSALDTTVATKDKGFPLPRSYRQ